MKTPTKQPANGGKLPPGANGPGVPGTRAADAVKHAARPAPVVVDPKRFGSDPRGSAPLVAGKAHIEVRDNRSKVNR
jgi:hypothetical protein